MPNMTLKFTSGEQWMLNEGKTMYMQKMKGMNAKDAKEYPVDKWAHELLWSVAKANCDIPTHYKIKPPK